MSEDLKRQYRMLADSKAPDLWERIEKGLDRPDMRTVSDVPFLKKDRRFRYGPLITVAAACLCVAVALPLLAKNVFGGGTGSRMDNAAPPAVMEEGLAGGAGADIMQPEAAAEDAVALSGCASPADAPAEPADDRITATVEISGAGKECGDGTVYPARVIHTDGADVGTRIQILAPAESSISCEVGGTYDLSLYREETEDGTVYRIAE